MKKMIIFVILLLTVVIVIGYMSYDKKEKNTVELGGVCTIDINIGNDCEENLFCNGDDWYYPEPGFRGICLEYCVNPTPSCCTGKNGTTCFLGV